MLYMYVCEHICLILASNFGSFIRRSKYVDVVVRRQIQTAAFASQVNGVEARSRDSKRAGISCS
jgi:hypothetical protein